MTRAITSPQAPAAIGPYSQAVIAHDHLVFCSGQTPLDPSGQLVNGGVDTQTAQVLANLQAVLAAEGLDFSHVVKTTVFLTDLADFETVNQVYRDIVGATATVLPARTTVQVAALPRGARVEIDAIAVR